VTELVCDHAGDLVAAEIAVLVQANLADIGGDITIQQDDPNAFLERTFSTRDFDLTFGYYTTDIIDPDELASFAVLSDGGTMALGSGYNNPDVDAMIRQAQTELDPAARQEIYNQIQAQQLADAPFIFLYYPGGRSATQKYVKNFNILPTGNYRLWETWRDDV